MKIKMKKSREVSKVGSKVGSGGYPTAVVNNGSHLNQPRRKIRIAVFGQQNVGKSALSVRFLTRRYIGVYQSDADLVYVLPLTISKLDGPAFDIEIVDISASVAGPEWCDRTAFPVEEIHRADGFIIVYSITDRSSFNTAMEALVDIHHYKTPTFYPTPPPSKLPRSRSRCSSPHIKPIPIALIANKVDLSHLRVVSKSEGADAGMKYRCKFYELSAADNASGVCTSFQSIIVNVINLTWPNLIVARPQPKRKFSMGSIILRLIRNTPSNTVLIPTAQPKSIVTNVTSSRNGSVSGSPAVSRESSPAVGGKVDKLVVNKVVVKEEEEEDKVKGDDDREDDKVTQGAVAAEVVVAAEGGEEDSISNNLKLSKLVELQSMNKTRQHSPPICSL